MRFALRWLLLFAALAPLASADEIQGRLNTATERYEQAIAAIELEVSEYFSELIDEYQRRGDFEKTVATQELHDKFIAEGVLPDVAALRSIRQKTKLQFSQADRDFRTACRRALKEYTKAKDLRAAHEVQRSLKDFDESRRNSAVVFPRANKPLPDPAGGPEAAHEPGVAANEDQPKPVKTLPKTTKQPGIAFQTAAFDYATNNGNCVIGDGEKAFKIRFSSSDAASVHTYGRDPTIRRIAVARGILPGAKLRFRDFDSSSDVHTVEEKQIFMVENAFGYYLVARIVQVRCASHGEGADTVLFDYLIGETAGDDLLTAPPVR